MIATWFQTVSRAAWLLAATVAVAIAGNIGANTALAAWLPAEAVGHFVYFSFWNQLPVFALANLVYLIAYKPRILRGEPARQTVSWKERRLLAAALAMLALLAYMPLPRSFGLVPPWVPNFFASSLCLSAICVLVSGDQPRLLINPWIAKLGVVSFSGYLWHWQVLRRSRTTVFGQWLYAQESLIGLAAYSVALVLVTMMTFAAATATYYLVESPGIALSRRLISWRRSGRLAYAGGLTPGH